MKSWPRSCLFASLTTWLFLSAAQAVEVDAARAKYGDSILILGKRQQQMFERRIFVVALIGVGESPKRLFEIA